MSGRGTIRPKFKNVFLLTSGFWGRVEVSKLACGRGGEGTYAAFWGDANLFWVSAGTSEGPVSEAPMII